MKRLLLFTAVLMLTGCPKHIVRDATVYQAELDQYDNWATSQAELLRGFMAEQCECSDTGEFTTQVCADAADYVLTIEARAEWHKAMSLYNAGLTDEKPADTPPEIPASDTLCPNGGE